jgi:membrane associated rhomboid family serine protease
MLSAILLYLYVMLYVLLTLFVYGLIEPMPFSDTGAVRYRTLPYMTLLLIIVNSMVFLAWQAPDMVRGAERAYIEKVITYGFRMTMIRQGLGIGAFSTFTSMFMHADFNHLLGNMFFLWTFGRRIEDACGPWRYLLYYLLAGMVANVGYSLLNPAGNNIPGIGASGAIAGLMGAYLLLFPRAQVSCIWGIGMLLRLPVVAIRLLLGHDVTLWRWTLSLPAWIFLIYFAVRELLPSIEVVQRGEPITGVNNLAHITGFATALTIFFFVRKDLLTRLWSGRMA